MATATQGSFVGRTAIVDKFTQGTYSELYKSVNSELYHPTASNQNAAFMLVSGSGYKLSVPGGEILDRGLETGTMYPIKLAEVSCSTTTVVKLFR
jgi:hypothetical protein